MFKATFSKRNYILSTYITYVRNWLCAQNDSNSQKITPPVIPTWQEALQKNELPKKQSFQHNSFEKLSTSAPTSIKFLPLSSHSPQIECREEFMLYRQIRHPPRSSTSTGSSLLRAYSRAEPLYFSYKATEMNCNFEKI